MFSEHNSDCSLSIEHLFLIELFWKTDVTESSFQLADGKCLSQLIIVLHLWTMFSQTVESVVSPTCYGSSLDSLGNVHSVYSVAKCSIQLFSSSLTDLLQCLFYYCLQRVQFWFYCIRYIADSPYSLSQNTLKSSIMFMSHIYKQYHEVDDYEVAILVVFGARSPHFRFWTQPI